jgi:hypothetical protein
MSTQFFGRVVLGVATAVSLPIAVAACDQARTTEPHHAVRFAGAGNRDVTDSTTCRSGYQVVDGRVVCN